MLKHSNITKQTQRAMQFFEEKLAFTLGPVELKNNLDNEQVEIIDVRKAEDYDRSHIPTAISLPASDIELRMNSLSKSKINIVYCYTEQCHLAAQIALKLSERGYPVMELEGGFDTWKNVYDFNVVSS